MSPMSATRRTFFVTTRVIDVILCPGERGWTPPWLIEETIKEKKKKEKKKRKEEGCNAGCWGKGKISAWVSRERLRDRGDGRLNIGFSDARGTYLMSYIFRWAAHSNFHSPTVSLRGEEKKETKKKEKESYILFSS